MKVDIQHVEKSQGLVFKNKLHGVSVSVQFSEEEKAIINERKLHHDVILERSASADVDPEKHERKGLAKRIAVAAVGGTNHFHLTFGKLMKGPDTYFLTTPLEAKEYDGMLRETLTQSKQYLLANEEVGDGGSFEI